MKKVSSILGLFFIITLMVSSCGSYASNETATFNEVKIGKQVWMTKNLNLDKFRNGDPIPHAKTDDEFRNAGKNKQPAWCYYENDTANGERFGKLYNWYAVNDARGLAPNGWHIPNDEEWKSLINNLGGENIAGTKMKSVIDWNENGNGKDQAGFLGLPGGKRSYNCRFLGIGNYSYWWSSTENGVNDAWNYSLSYKNSIATREYFFKENGFSVRCLRN
jgi:uncharacterized protein (TIGR02145 family)